MKVSDKPWSQFSDSDYTPEQMRQACAYAPEGAKSKAEMKLPQPP